MKILVIIIVLFSLSSCEKQFLKNIMECKCSNVVTNRIEPKKAFTEKEKHYYKFWKDYFISDNQWDSQEFYDKIIVTDVKFNYWSAGISCRVEYFYLNSWAAVNCYDSFLIMLKSDYSAYQYTEMPRDTMLNSEWISYCIRNNIASSQITEIKPDISIKFESCEDAYSFLRRNSEYEVLENFRLSFYVTGRGTRMDGYPYLFARGQISLEDNKCVRGKMNLVTGEWEVFERSCYI